VQAAALEDEVDEVEVVDVDDDEEEGCPSEFTAEGAGPAVTAAAAVCGPPGSPPLLLPVSQTQPWISSRRRPDVLALPMRVSSFFQ